MTVGRGRCICGVYFEGGINRCAGGWGGARSREWKRGGKDDSLISSWNNRGDGVILSKMGKPVEKQVWRKASAFKQMPQSLSHWNSLDHHLAFFSKGRGVAVNCCLVETRPRFFIERVGSNRVLSGSWGLILMLHLIHSFYTQIVCLLQVIWLGKDHEREGKVPQSYLLASSFTIMEKTVLLNLNVF